MSSKNIFEFDNLFKSSKFSDFQFILTNQNGVKVIYPVHSIILGSRSAIMEQMCTDKSGSFEIHDVEAEIFEEYLQFFYLNKVNIMHIEEVCTLIEKYNSLDIWPVIERYLSKSLNGSNAYQFYKISLKFDALRLLNLEIEKLIRDKPSLVVSLGWEVSTIDTHALTTILKRDDLWVNEYTLLRGLHNFSYTTLRNLNREYSIENIQEIMSKQLLNIRFPIMSEYRLYCANNEGFLREDDYLDILNHVQSGAPLTVAKKYNSEPRKYYELFFLRADEVMQFENGRYRHSHNKIDKDYCLGTECTLKLKTVAGTKFKCYIEIFLQSASNRTVELTIKNGEMIEEKRCFRRTFSFMRIRWNELIEFESLELSFKLSIPVSKKNNPQPTANRRNLLPKGMTMECDSPTFIRQVILKQVD